MSSPLTSVILATKNLHKVEEITAYLAEYQITFLSLLSVEGIPEIIEDGSTFYENALIKAKAVFEYTRKPALADDSGLVVEALNGAPGVHSARYAGVGASSEMMIAKLLKAMQELPDKNRNAYFETSIVFYYEKEGVPIIRSSRGIVSGTILKAPRGELGFGYDPVFLPEGCNLSFAELSLSEKNSMSHRSRALSKFLSSFRESLPDLQSML